MSAPERRGCGPRAISDDEQGWWTREEERQRSRPQPELPRRVGPATGHLLWRTGSMGHLGELKDPSRYAAWLSQITDSNEAPAETHEVGANRVLVWQKHVPSGNEGYTVVATLERVK